MHSAPDAQLPLVAAWGQPARQKQTEAGGGGVQGHIKLPLATEPQPGASGVTWQNSFVNSRVVDSRTNVAHTLAHGSAHYHTNGQAISSTDNVAIGSVVSSAHANCAPHRTRQLLH
jgi:hypothetical protein